MSDTITIDRGRTIADFIRLARKHRGAQVMFNIAYLTNVAVPASTLAKDFATDSRYRLDKAAQPLLTEVRRTDTGSVYISITAPGEANYEARLERFDAAETPAAEQKAA